MASALINDAARAEMPLVVPKCTFELTLFQSLAPSDPSTPPARCSNGRVRGRPRAGARGARCNHPTRAFAKAVVMCWGDARFPLSDYGAHIRKQLPSFNIVDEGDLPVAFCDRQRPIRMLVSVSFFSSRNTLTASAMGDVIRLSQRAIKSQRIYSRWRQKMSNLPKAHSWSAARTEPYPLREVARAAFMPAKTPAGLEGGLYDTGTFHAPSDTWPTGAHVCEVELDPQTGAVEVVSL
jgi:CO/xanthine dehydrogenase Mo-binding subunit